MIEQSRNSYPNITSAVNQIALITGEMETDNGEDAYGYFFNENGGILAAYDGCGGLGSKRYERYGFKTGAYIASRTVGHAVFQWFMDFSMNGGRINENTILQIKEELFQEILAGLAKVKTEESFGASQLKKGDLVRELPTTISTILFDAVQNGINTAFIWAGDSRGYILTAEGGLAQISTDDLTGDHDAYENLYADGRLSNVVAADGKYHLNHKILSITTPFMAITATDGCFGYFKTPMEFEYILLSALLNAQSPLEWKQGIEEAIRKVARDDFSLCFATFGYEEFQEIKNSFYQRGNYLYNKYISMLAIATEEEKKKMWLEYKKDYNRWLD
jgi:serine/threonine protein phosphatase PrpC